MSDSIRAGDFRICPSCGSRNKAAYNFCVRCSGAMDAVATGVAGSANESPTGSSRTLRVVLAAGVVAAIGAGLVIRSILAQAPVVTEDVRADSAGTVDVPAPPPPVSGWVPGAGVAPQPETTPSWSSRPAPAWSSESFPVARPNPYDVPGDPSASMVGIAPSAPAVRAAKNRRRVYTETDLLATRGGVWSSPMSETTSTPAAAPERSEIGERDSKARMALEDALDDVEDARDDAARAARKLEESRRQD